MRKKLTQYPLLNQMTTYIFILGLIMAVSLSCFKLYLNYGQGIKNLKSHLSNIEKTQVRVLAKNIWAFNEETIVIQLNSILQHPDIIYLELNTNDNQYTAGIAPQQQTNILKKSFPLFFNFKGENNKIADLSILATTDSLKHQLLSQVPGIIAVECGKMIIVCVFILIIFHYLFNRHLRTIAHYTRTMDFNHLDTPLVLQKTSSKNDELDRIVSAINTMRKRLQTGLAEKEKLEEDLRHSQKMEAIGTLAGGIAHDFNNILTAIFGFTELASFHLDDQEKLQDDLGEVRHGANRAKKLVQQILTFSRKSAPAMQPLHLSLVVQEAVKLLQSTIPATIEIHLHLQSTNLKVLADATQIHQIIMNICTNSYHAMRDTGGKLDIILKDQEESIPPNTDLPYLELLISDTGTGMDQNTQKKIFEPYFTTKEKGQGTGLGLAVVHGIIQNHKGTISVSSELNKGTTFRITLPTVQTEIPAENTLHPSTTQGNGEHILYVDDEDKILSLAREIITSYGYTVTTHHDPQQALTAFKQSPADFDLIITDMTMPKLTGIEFTRAIMEIDTTVPVLLCSGYSDLIDKESALELGVKEYIHKPIVMSELVYSIQKALQNNKIQ